jgi:hypothetical protein
MATASSYCGVEQRFTLFLGSIGYAYGKCWPWSTGHTCKLPPLTRPLPPPTQGHRKGHWNGRSFGANITGSILTTNRAITGSVMETELQPW